MEVTTHYNGYPSLVRRIQSSVIDFLLILALMVAITQLADQFDNFPSELRTLFFVLIFLYEPLCVTFGCTLGNYIMRIRVRGYDDENKRINLFQSIIRYAVKILLGWLSFVTIHTNTQKRAIHDMFIGSVMVELP